MKLLSTFAAVLLALASITAAAATPSTLSNVGVQLYQPNDELVERVGDAAEPLAKYIETLQDKVMAYWGTSGQAGVDGILVTVGVKPGGKTRVWIDTIGSKLSQESLLSLETQLEQIAPIPVQKGPFAFCMRFQVSGQKPAQFPDIPSAWSDAGKTAGHSLEVPDGVFDVIWKD